MWAWQLLVCTQHVFWSYPSSPLLHHLAGIFRAWDDEASGPRSRTIQGDPAASRIILNLAGGEGKTLDRRIAVLRNMMLTISPGTDGGRADGVFVTERRKKCEKPNAVATGNKCTYENENTVKCFSTNIHQHIKSMREPLRWQNYEELKRNHTGLMDFIYYLSLLFFNRVATDKTKTTTGHANMI